MVNVSIPSSSGHQFTGRHGAIPVRRVRAGFNPFFIRASVYWVMPLSIKSRLVRQFQSLLHQGISLLASSVLMRRWTSCLFQSLLHQGISLLGLPLCSCMQVYTMFQSLLHQGISLLFASPCRGCGADSFKVSIPSSSGHQFTDSNVALIELERERSFNPFFIRASVYCRIQG